MSDDSFAHMAGDMGARLLLLLAYRCLSIARCGAAPLPDCSSVPTNRYCSYCNIITGAYMACVAQGGRACQVSLQLALPRPSLHS